MHYTFMDKQYGMTKPSSLSS